jgi:hypothetical protein
MSPNLAEGLLAAEAIAQEIMSCIRPMSTDTETLYLAIPKHGPRFETVNGSLGDLALHPAIPASDECWMLIPKIESNLKAPERKRGSSPGGHCRPLAIN